MSRYGIYICDPAPWERKHDWRIPAFFPLVTSLNPDFHGPWVLPAVPGTRDRIYPGQWVRSRGGENVSGYHTEDYFNRRRYWTRHKEKANQMAAKIRRAHPHLLVRVDEIP